MSRAPIAPANLPLAARLGVAPLYGDIHNHCDLSYGHGRFTDALARAALQLDFVSITGHAYWPDMPVDDPDVAHIVDFHVKGFAKLRAGWEAHYETLRESDGDDLIVFPGYEIHSSAHGDYTIVYRDLEPAPVHLADSPAELRDTLAREMPGRSLAFPHHIGYRRGARGINWDSFEKALSPFVEMNSMHGCAETSESARSYLHSMGPLDGHSTMQRGLAEGHVFGVVGNTDHHSAFPGSYGHGRMAAYVANGGRDALWDAFISRHTLALTGANIHLLSAVGEAVQGDTVPPMDEAALDIEAVAGGAIDSIDIVRNGRLFSRITPALAPAPIIGGEADRFETILFLEMGWGARGTSHRWEGALAVEGGEIRSVEPRFRGSEVVSPLEGDDNGFALPSARLRDGRVRFSLTAQSNPNNATSATQGFAARLSLSETGAISADLCGRKIVVPARRLLEGALSGNLGAIDSPAYRFHALPRPEEWQWRGRVSLGALQHGENIYVRLRQSDGQMAWASPLFCRNGAGTTNKGD